MQTIIDRAGARFEERRLIDRAKAVLMQMRGLDEEAAYAFIRKAAMESKDDDGEPRARPPRGRGRFECMRHDGALR